MFEGVVGSTAFSDIAIDDVEFQENTECEKTAETLVPARIISISSNQTAYFGSNVTLVCTAIGSPQPTIVWRKNGKVFNESQVTGNITLLNISQADGGFYECSVSNHLATESRTMELKVEGYLRETTITANISFSAVALGDAVVIKCSSNGYPTPVCRIQREDNSFNINESVYVIQNFTPVDQGHYLCSCSNVAGVMKANITLALYESPNITAIHPAYQLVNETDTFEIFCNVTGNPTPAITWSKLSNTSKVNYTGQTLRITNAQISDFGSYRCTAVSERGENVSADALVEVDNSAASIVQGPQNITVMEKERKKCYPAL